MVERGDPFSLLGTQDFKSEVLGPVLDSPVLKQYSFNWVSPVKSHEDDWDTGTSFIWRQDASAGAVQPREENAGVCVWGGCYQHGFFFPWFFFKMGREVH